MRIYLDHNAGAPLRPEVRGAIARFGAADDAANPAAVHRGGQRARRALEQARAAAGWLCGKPRPYRSVPWFWSDQYDLKLQMVGVPESQDDEVVRVLQRSGFRLIWLDGDRQAARREMLLAMRGMLDHVIKKIDEKA
jgi:NADPH-dependent 2,4-dienoyl-CoA reductase/sulfur reductase-like enzyme